MIEKTLSHGQAKNLLQWLSYLENLHSKEIDLGLTRITQVAERLAIDLSFAKVITVAGTNGKGTTCAFIENALFSEKLSESEPQKSYQQKSTQQNTVAVYSSPHIEHFNERLRIDKQDIDDISLIRAFEKIEQARGDISLSYYEYTTLAAFLVLMAVKPHYIILEVGLGGRLDATNIIDADIAVITTIDIDHVSFLGDNREVIGYEKAGIMRTKRPVVIGDTSPPLSVLAHAKNIAANVIVREQNFYINQLTNIDNEPANRWQYSCSFSQDQQPSAEQQEYVFSPLNKPFIPLDNVATALTVLNQLAIPLTTKTINTWIEKTKVAGRMEHFVNGGTDIVLDVAHNPQAARYLASELQQQGYDKIHAVVAMMSDKDINAALVPLLTIVDEWYLGNLSLARAASSEQMASILSQLNQPYNCFDNVNDAFKMACINSKKNELVLVFGSFFTVAAIRPLLLS
ncbi:MAG: bifunctional tetrahydrofolate synthase/dihydrofolate synthase [Alteromonadaceae bacterium]|nr:bifunctional tetrahydrofolate synthase/dihydrofolate synthase [Alteromonadaceae bacterium]